MRAFAPSELHVTVAFLGSVDEQAARAAWAAVTWPLEPMVVSLCRVVPMGPPARYSALSALIMDGAADVEAAIARTRGTVCMAAGVAPDPRPPKAHVTLARARRRASTEERREGLAWANAIALPPVRVTLAVISLYTWAEDRSERLFRIAETRTTRLF
jgi:2'-5' RNA ligase